MLLKNTECNKLSALSFKRMRKKTCDARLGIKKIKRVIENDTMELRYTFTIPKIISQLSKTKMKKNEVVKRK